MLKGAIFDFDGTLFDSMFVWDTAGETYLRSMGKEPEEKLQEALRTMCMRQSAEYIGERYGISLPVDEIMAGIGRTVEDLYVHTVEPKSGVIAWLEELHAREIRMCVATAAERHHVEAALQRCGMEHFFSEIVTCSAVGSGKDQPLIFREALKHLGTDRSETVVVEDAFYALRTAKMDGFLTAAVYDSHESRQGELRAMADVYLRDYHDLAPFREFMTAQ